jgi:hypothetical protein
VRLAQHGSVGSTAARRRSDVEQTTSMITRARVLVSMTTLVSPRVYAVSR